MIYMKVFGGKKVKQVIERTFSPSADARQYLEEWGIKRPSKDISGTHFDFADNAFTLSHSIEDIWQHDNLPDNEASLAHKPVNKSFKPMDATGRNTGRTKSDISEEVNPKPRGKSTLAQAAGVIVKDTGKTVCLKEICRDIDMDPRVARQRLRKLNPGNGKQRWEWSASEAEVIKQKLKGGK